jgi:hypothetical protein
MKKLPRDIEELIQLQAAAMTGMLKPLRPGYIRVLRSFAQYILQKHGAKR